MLREAAAIARKARETTYAGGNISQGYIAAAGDIERQILALLAQAPEQSDTQSDAVRELEWQPIEEYPLDQQGRPVEAVNDDRFLLVIAPELLDEDFNPTGIGQAHCQDGGTLDEHVEPWAWVAPKWCNCHDEYHLRVVTPSHFAFVSRTAIRNEAADTGGEA